ncbi:site-specific integrase [Acidicapsa acidisoli]|uniref:site-specific integrase n=1 Tax=Acidicapsa acidisoli TaxID=1615681 RepID=UPI0021E0B0F6|nr:site-specific integrase [Acidicapsa acidisoli]
MSNEPGSVKSARALTSDQYVGLADVPPEIEWLANITNDKTRRSYKSDVAKFVAFTGLKNSAALRTVAHSHVNAWRKDMQTRSLGAVTIRRKLSALSLLFDYLCERNAVLGNPWTALSGPPRILRKVALQP